MTTVQNKKIQSLQTDKLSESLKSANWPHNKQITNQAYYTNTSNTNHHDHKQVYHNTEVRASSHLPNQQSQSIYKDNMRQQSHQVTYQYSFKKNKGKDSQINRLMELKQQYQILKNMNVQQSMIYTHKSRQHSMEQSSSKSQAISSKKSMKSYQIESRGKHIIEYEKKQLEVMLNNSMSKVEQLLKNEIEYKRKIHELSNKSTSHEQIDDLMKIHKKQQKQLLQTIENLRKQHDHLRQLNRKLSEKVGNLEAQLSEKDIDLKKVSEQRRKNQEQIYVNREKIMMAEIQNKRVKMEYQILEKDKASQISYLKRLLDEDRSHHYSNDQTQLQQLKQEIKLKDHRYQLLLQQLQSIKKTNAVPKTDPTQSIFQELLLKLQNNQQPDSQSAIVYEIRQLKQHLQAQKVDLQLEQKIRSLQKIIQQQNLQKSKFMEELRSMSSDYDQLYSQNQQLKQRIRNNESELRRLKKQLYGTKQQLEMSQHAKLQLSVSRQQNTQYINKTIQKLQQQNKELALQYNDLKHTLKGRQQELQDQIRKLRRQVDESNFRIQKLVKQNQFNMDIANSKLATQTDLLNKQVARITNQRDQWKRQFDNMKAFYEKKLHQLRSQTQQFNQQWNKKITMREEQILKVRGQNQGNINNLRSKYENEQTSLLARLDSLMESNQRLAKENAKFVHMESELYQLRQQIRRMYQLNANVDHLWSIKEAEYANVNDIIQNLH